MDVFKQYMDVLERPRKYRRYRTIRLYTLNSYENIRDAVVYSGEGGHVGDIVKLISNDKNFLSIWVNKRSIGHRLTLRSGEWKLDSAEKLSSETVVDLMVRYLHSDLSTLKEIQWTRPIDKILLDKIMKLKN